jgi:hypothetical protein
MRGLALMLKGLYPKLDWSTPEATLQSLIPGFDLNQGMEQLKTIGLYLQSLGDMRREQLEAQLRMEAKIDRLYTALIERSNDGRRINYGPGDVTVADYGTGTDNDNDTAAGRHTGNCARSAYPQLTAGRIG